MKPFMEYDENGNETTNIDFSFEYEGKTVLMQVAYEINFLNEKREIQNLLDIEGNYSKCIVYKNNMLREEEKGLIYLRIDDFLKSFLD